MSNHPNFNNFKKTHLKDLQPGVREGWLKKKGYDFHTWKKRYFIIKNEFIYYFSSANPTSTPKGVIELNSKSQAKIIDDTFMNIVICSVHRNQEIIADTPDMGAAWVDSINSHIKTLQKVEEQRKKEAELVSTPFCGKSWPEVKNEINVCKHLNERQVPPTELIQIMNNVGKDTCERYFYNILLECITTWSDDEIANFVWNYFCRHLVRQEEVQIQDKMKRRKSIMKTESGTMYKLLSDLNIIFGGTQGAVLTAFGGESENSDDIIMVLGRNTQAGVRLAAIYNYIIENNKISFNEVIRTILDAMERWRMRTEEPMFRAFVTGITGNWNPAKVASLVSFLSSFTKEHDSFPLFEEPWEELPPHALSFILAYANHWNTEEKKEFITIGNMLWGWKIETYNKLTNQI
ncbi:pleckstrin domain containing family protein [Entamoeba histolytica HM-1:IMSS-B]|uniref:PH domain-containing protein n=6 Tax=Entamoeba histolytica TaxID=5759 RepID=C4M4M2_ENTH1|nr:hypothetical protein EHI_031330 [Entamoeba histolytica HM-1:IMSS]EMD47731.1 PH domain containing protein [Entamoeba histolytica KU27]EMH75406.1 pleckstrin domain containing family protein [Entamoeba histolytica HM-1:IMSS-B]EMS14042.1 pleckstrin (PH) domain containing family protein [Entamoeba histolytica HM-3:IMSS]ENY64884.1 pleckstrin (PH) domain containing family protein [Entamoeba histolytica HM-1:IMSS-A]GAT96318.1 hypothetical protein CL6EHI_031330 [Entamoeba histolytica]|eukprot:XP_654091.1 hypothetical protein EHI_031330 [Entamoeba histolytica HM-1:IMSS]